MFTWHPIELLTDEAFGWYFTGLTDGEGCFQLVLQGRPKQRVKPTWKIAFTMTMRADEAGNITAIARRLGCGNVTVNAASLSPRRDGTKRRDNPAVTWGVSRFSDLSSIIVPHFERFPLQCKKSRDFDIWKQAVAIYAQARARSNGTKRQMAKFTSDEFAAIADLRRQLEQVRQYDHPSGFPDVCR